MGWRTPSCEFNVQSLQPTYRLLTGIPGKSNAFAIAARLGLQPTIIERAKEQVSTEDARFEDVLAELERERRRIEQMKEEAQKCAPPRSPSGTGCAPSATRPRRARISCSRARAARRTASSKTRA